MTSQTVILKQAVFGEVRGAHAVREATYQTPNLASLAMRLDLPDQAPVGVTWEPYLSGFPFEGHYVLAHIRPDPGATRAGMILCRAVVIAPADLSRISDLSQIADIVKDKPPDGPLADIQLIPNETGSDDFGDLGTGLANVLSSRSAFPAVLGQGEGAEQAVFQIWRHLPVSVRGGFAFRLSFAPKDLAEVPQPAAVFVPEPLRNRWSSDRLVGEDSSFISPLAEILGGRSSVVGLDQLASQLGVTPKSTTDLIRLNLADTLLSGSTFENVLAGFRLVQTMPPDVGADLSGRANIVARLSHLLAAEPLQSVMLLRNVTDAGFASIEALWQALESRVAATKFDRADDTTIFGLLDDARKTAAAEMRWKRAVITGLSAARQTLQKQFNEMLWRYTGPPEALVVLDAIEGEGRKVAHLVAAVPDCPVPPAAKAMEWLGRDLDAAELVAVALRAQAPLQDALREYIAFDPKLSSAAALDHLFAKGSAAEVFGAVSGRPARAMVDSAARAMVRDPVRFSAADFGKDIVRQVWGAALAISPSAWSTPKDVDAAIAGVLISLSKRDSVDEDLLDAISKSPHSNISSFADRAALWDAMPGNLRGRFLRSTAAGWLASVSEGSLLFEPDSQLKSEILKQADFSSRLGKVLRTGNVKTLLLAVSALGGLSETQFCGLLDSVRASDAKLNATEAADLGKYVASKGWSEAALSLKAAFERGRKDLRPALEACQALLPRWLRYSLGLGTPSDNEAWEMLRDLAVGLYPYGPDDRHLWKRSGGDNSKLAKGRGETVWYDAIDMMRMGNAVKPEKLLQEMKRDFSSNAQVIYLADLTLFRSKSGGLFSLFSPFGMDK